MIEQGLRLFDQLVVAVGRNPEKKCLFDLAERKKMLTMINTSERARIWDFDGFLIHFAQEQKAQAILRGIRSVTDYEYERTMRHINNDIAPEITTVFLMPPREIAEVSSSMVKGLVGPDGWEELVAKYVDPYILERLKEKA
jgi:pantetheine-phosphate adenylyltransferase